MIKFQQSQALTSRFESFWSIVPCKLDPFIGPVYSYTSVSEETLLQNIHEALQRESVTTEVLVGLLTLLCIILTTLVVYLCYTRGIASLSRYVM